MSHTVLDKLHHMLVLERSLERIWDYYFDNQDKLRVHLMRSIEQGEVDFPELEIAIALACQHHFKLKDRYSCSIFKLNRQFYHGLIVSPPGIHGALLFSEKKRLGTICAITMRVMQTEFVRFSLPECVPDREQMH